MPGNTGASRPSYTLSLFYNPAGLAKNNTGSYEAIYLSPFFEGNPETLSVYEKTKGSNGFSETFDYLESRYGKPLHLGLSNMTGVAFGSWAIASVQSVSVDALIFRDPERFAMRTFKFDLYKNVAFIIGYGNKINENISFGISFYYLQRQVIHAKASTVEVGYIQKFKIKNHESSGEAIGSNIGMLYEFGNRLDSAIGLQVKHLGNSTFKVKTQKTSIMKPLPQEITLGYSHRHKPAEWVSIIPHIDLVDLLGDRFASDLYKLHLGLDARMWDLWGLMTGINEGYFSFSSYLDFKNFRLDLGYYSVEQGEYLGHRQDSRLFLSLIGRF